MLASPNCQEEGWVLGAQGVGRSLVPAVVVVNLNALPLKLLDLLPCCCTQQTTLNDGGHIVR